MAFDWPHHMGHGKKPLRINVFELSQSGNFMSYDEMVIFDPMQHDLCFTYDRLEYPSKYNGI